MRKSYRKTYGYVEKYYPMKKRHPYICGKKLSKSRKLWRDKLSLKRKNTRCPRSSVATPPGARVLTSFAPIRGKLELSRQRHLRYHHVS